MIKSRPPGCASTKSVTSYTLLYVGVHGSAADSVNFTIESNTMALDTEPPNTLYVTQTLGFPLLAGLAPSCCATSSRVYRGSPDVCVWQN